MRPSRHCAGSSPVWTCGRSSFRERWRSAGSGLTISRRPRMATPTLLRWIAFVLRIAAVLATLFVGAGLVGFLTDEVRDSSKVSATRITLLDNGRATRTVDITQP